MKRFFVLTSLLAIFLLAGCASSATAPAPTPQVTPTATPKLTPSPQPPATAADLRGLAAKGDANAIHPFHSESVGAAGVCPEPKTEVTVDPSVTGEQLVEDLLAYFYAQQFDSNPCGVLVLAYHNQGEADNAYTAGRISTDVTDSSGVMNFDPNAVNLKRQLTLDIGSVDTSQESVVTY